MIRLEEEGDGAGTQNPTTLASSTGDQHTAVGRVNLPVTTPFPRDPSSAKRVAPATRTRDLQSVDRHSHATMYEHPAQNPSLKGDRHTAVGPDISTSNRGNQRLNVHQYVLKGTSFVLTSALTSEQFAAMR